MTAAVFVHNAVVTGGAAASGAKLYSYVKGTSTPLSVYVDNGLTEVSANPYVADGNGRIKVYFSDLLNYKFVIKTSDDVTTLMTADFTASGRIFEITYADVGNWDALQAAMASLDEEFLAALINVSSIDAEVVIVSDAMVDVETVADNIASVQNVANSLPILTSSYAQTDAGLTAAVAAAATSGRLLLDSNVVILSTWSGGSNITLIHSGGTIAPPASTATFTWQGDIAGSPTDQMFTGANIAQVRVTNKCQFVRPEWFGAVNNGSTDDLLPLRAAIAACRNGSGIKLMPGSGYAHSAKLTIGDGTSTTRSTIHHGFFMECDTFPGVGDGDYGTPNLLCSFVSTAAVASASEVMIEILGGLHSLRFRNFIQDANNKAGTGIRATQFYRCLFENVYVMDWYTNGYAWDLDVWDSATYGAGIGVTIGTFNNRFIQSGTRTPGARKCHALRIKGGPTNNKGFSVNTFQDFTLARGNTSDSISLDMEYVDNNNFHNCWAYGQPSGTGYAVVRRVTAGTIFPGENQFYAGHWYGNMATWNSGGTDTTDDGGWDIFFGYPNKDSADLTLPWGLKAITPQGRMLSGWGGFAGPVANPGHIKGCTLSNNGTDATNDIDIAAGSCIDSTDAFYIQCAAMTKRLDANWSAGTGNGFRDSANAINNFTYHIYAVAKIDGNNQDYYATTQATEALALTALRLETGGSSYVWARRIGSILRESGAIVLFTQRGDEFLRKGTPFPFAPGANPGTSALTVNAGTPSGIQVDAIMSVTLSDVTADATTYVLVTSPDQTDTTPSSSAFSFFLQSIVVPTAANESIASRWRTSTSAQIRIRLSQSTTDHFISAQGHGWVDTRGRM